MTASSKVSDKSTKVWRYMSYARFVWLLQTRKLWFARTDYLGDPWEISLAGDQLAHVISTHPISPIGEPPAEPVLQRSERIIKFWREHTFINCWSASDHESHALWRIYCPTSEGVAIQTTLAKLEESLGPVHSVTYENPGSKKQTPTREDLVTHKRPMFAHEKEVRLIRFIDAKGEPKTVGRGLGWDYERYVESICVHPEAHQSFMDTVIGTVGTYAPLLKDKVVWSSMNVPPPF